MFAEQLNFEHPIRNFAVGWAFILSRAESRGQAAFSSVVYSIFEQHFLDCDLHLFTLGAQIWCINSETNTMQIRSHNT